MGKFQNSNVWRNINISQICDFEWFKWVIFQDKIAPYLDDHFKLGRYLGPSIDVCPAMMAKILTKNSQVLHRSTYHALTQEDWGSEESKEKSRTFMKSVLCRLSP